MSNPVLRVQDLAVHYTSETGHFLRRRERVLKAVDGISFELEAGETLGIVGESGSGKSTLARAIVGLIKPSRGRVLWDGEDLTRLDGEELRQKRKDIQLVFQDPVASLNPRMTAGAIIAEPLDTFYPQMERVQVEEHGRAIARPARRERERRSVVGDGAGVVDVLAAAQVADVETGARRARRRAGVVALEISVACRDAQAIGGLPMNGELVGVPRTASDAVAPGAAAIDRGHERASLDCNPESFRFEWVARDPANVMSVRPRRKRPFR